MSQNDIIRAWKDADFRVNLTDAQRSQLPDNPAGMMELSDEVLEAIAGGAAPSQGGGGCRPSHREGGCKTK